MKKKILIAVTGLLLSGFDLSAQEIQFGKMGYGGTGCPVGKEPLLQINNRVGNVKFDQYVLNSRIQLIDRRNCSIRLPISQGAGYQVGVKISTVDGQVAQAKNVSSSVAASVSLVGSTKTSALNKSWTSKVNSRYQAVSAVTGDYAWSNCNGQDAMLAINSSIVSNRMKTSAVSLISVDQLTFDFAVRRCVE